MKIEEYFETLPQNLLKGNDVQLPKKAFNEIFKLVNLGEDDVFYHLGCGDQTGIEIAINQFNVKRAVGIDNNTSKIYRAKKEMMHVDNVQVNFICNNVIESDISDASVILFWFTNEKIIEEMLVKFNRLKPGTRIVTVWGPLPGCLPNAVNFPFIVNETPFKMARDIQEQLQAIFNVKCVDFETAWEFAERYTKSLGSLESKNDRFLTILQTLIIWINAKSLGITCNDGDIPESILTYANIMKIHFNIDFTHLLK